MNTKDDGGPAFPRSPHSGEVSDDGMTLRDYFAAKALIAQAQRGVGYEITRRNSEADEVSRARAAYEMADAMLEARK